MPFQLVDQHLVKHPKTRALARALGQHPRYAAGLLLEVWSWAIDAKPDGMIGEIPSETLAGIFGPVGRTLVERLTSAGFVCTERCASAGRDPVEHRPGRFHDWKQWAGKLVEGREKERLRGEHRRRGHPRPVDGCPKCEERPLDTPAQTQAGVHSTAPRPSASTGRPPDRRDRPLAEPSRTEPSRTEPSRTEPSRTEPSPPPPRTPAAAPQGDARARAELLIASADEPLQTALARMLDGGQLHSAAISTFFTGARLEQREGNGTWTLWVPNEFTRDWVRERYVNALREALQAEMVVCDRIDVELSGGPREPEPVEPES